MLLILLPRKGILVHLKVVYNLLIHIRRLRVDVYEGSIIHGGNLGLLGWCSPLIIGLWLWGVNHVVHF